MDRDISVGIATGYGWTVWGFNLGGGARFYASVQTGPGAHPASCTMGTGFFLGLKSGRGVKLTPHPLPVPRSRKSRAILLLPLWAVRPLQSLSACTVELYLYSLYGPYGLYRASAPVQGCTLPYLYYNTGCSEQNIGKHSVNLICFLISFNLPTVVHCAVLHV